jgi:hypothetical protein
MRVKCLSTAKRVRAHGAAPGHLCEIEAREIQASEETFEMPKIRAESRGNVHPRWQDGDGSLSVTGHAGHNYATTRPDGDSNVFGATVALDFTVNKQLAWGTFLWWERDLFNADNVEHFHPDTLDNTILLTRRDNLYEVGAYLVWDFAPTWSLRPELVWIRDQSNSIGFNYSSTEFWLNVRKSF